MAEKKPVMAAAIITIRDAAKMTPRGRRDIAAWIRRTAEDFEKNADKLARIYRTRYM